MSLYEEGQRIATESLDTSAVTVLSPSLLLLLLLLLLF